MSRVVTLHDREVIARFIARAPALHLYALGDLDDFFWPFTVWYALEDRGEVRQLVLTYFGGGGLVLLALCHERIDEMRALLGGIVHLLPSRLYAHLSPGLADVFREKYTLEAHGLYRKMALVDASRGDDVDVSGAVALGVEDRAEIEVFYAAAYPGNWFDPRMLETGRYVGLRERGELVSVAGVHVYSRERRAAALGNVATHPSARGRGLATVVTAALCRTLRAECDVIGLNVSAENAAALACYQRLGFEEVIVRTIQHPARDRGCQDE